MEASELAEIVTDGAEVADDRAEVAGSRGEVPCFRRTVAGRLTQVSG